jgi:pimeloyl-ACP methyl ester carboxylesterase
MSPKYAGDLVDRILAVENKVDVLWIYGADDVAVSNSAASDPGSWGPTNWLPGFPGTDRYPPQPMMEQIRTLLEAYSGSGGHHEEIAIEGSGHVPFITHQDEFNKVFHAFLERVG